MTSRSIRKLRKIAAGYGLRLPDEHPKRAGSCHCWGIESGYPSVHAWWCPCSPQYGVRDASKLREVKDT